MAKYTRRTTWRPLPQNHTQPRIKPRTVVLHTAVSNGSSLYSFFNGRSAGVESHFYLRKNGTAEQYMDTVRRADCQNDGNSFAISVESWDGYPHGWSNSSDVPAWTPAQVEWLTDFLAWCHKTHGIPLRVSRRWNDSGIAWHRKYIGNPGFARSARACPGDRRITQIPGIIAAAKRKANGKDEDVVDKKDIDAIAKAVWAYPLDAVDGSYENDKPPAATHLRWARHHARQALKHARQGTADEVWSYPVQNADPDGEGGGDAPVRWHIKDVERTQDDHGRRLAAIEAGIRALAAGLGPDTANAVNAALTAPQEGTENR